jgi:hypothetical protein
MGAPGAIAGAGGSGLSLRSDDLDSISELYIEEISGKLVLPTSFSSLGELEDHGECGLESALTRPYLMSFELGVPRTASPYESGRMQVCDHAVAFEKERAIIDARCN